ncbi:MAG: cyclic nucleotide-binding domain-containing protein [Spirochaetales bacterium]|nr:cyclic nucleotide-binding domain-containing protein [Spirochaetales bacterium]MCF7939737.1 cyclic nucleotide-binding domain-containing protein [Spirochaetales bacterium]
MSLIGVMTSDDSLSKLVLEQLSNQKHHFLHVISNDEDITEFLNFSFPELIIVDFSDPSLDLESLLISIREDGWLHTFGIIGIYDRGYTDEDNLHERLTALNVITLLDRMQVVTQLAKCIRILENNRQILFSRDISSKLVDAPRGSAVINNDLVEVSVYAGIAATSLVHRGLIPPEGKMRVQLSLSELLVNAVEHGNCGISFQEKNTFLEKGGDILQLIRDKCSDPEIARKRVHFEWEIYEDRTHFIIQDEGDGFDVSKVMEEEELDDFTEQHGRGIRMASLIGEDLFYNEIGNEVTFVVKHDPTLEVPPPSGFQKGEIVHVEPGDVVLEPDHTGELLYYISSGRYIVRQNGKDIGILGPPDMFIGELSFLLNKRRETTVIAQTAGKLVKLPRKSFVATIKEHPHYGLYISRLLGERLDRANNLYAGGASEAPP